MVLVDQNGGLHAPEIFTEAYSAVFFSRLELAIASAKEKWVFSKKLRIGYLYLRCDKFAAQSARQHPATTNIRTFSVLSIAYPHKALECNSNCLLEPRWWWTLAPLLSGRLPPSFSRSKSEQGANLITSHSSHRRLYTPDQA